MEQAKYFCTGRKKEKSEYRHYALAVPYYTHFTSPIRRMADLVVHRQLAAALGDTTDVDLCKYDDSVLDAQAKLCNDRKINAKLAGEEGNAIYLWSMIKQITEAGNQFIMDGIVTDLVEFGFEILLVDCGQAVR